VKCSNAESSGTLPIEELFCLCVRSTSDGIDVRIAVERFLRASEGFENRSSLAKLFSLIAERPFGEESSGQQDAADLTYFMLLDTRKTRGSLVLRFQSGYFRDHGGDHVVGVSK
jgi:hypothetical protein